MKVEIGLKSQNGSYPVKVWDSKGVLIKKRNDLLKEEISQFMDKRFEKKEKDFLRKAIQLFRPPNILIKDKIILG